MSVQRLITHLSALLGTEIKLARHELRQSLSRAGIGLGLIGLALVLALPALSAFAIAAALGLMAAGLAPGWAALCVALAFSAGAGVCLLLARRCLNAEALKPHRTLAQLRADLSALKEVAHV